MERIIQSKPGMNAALRSIVRMGGYVGCKVYLIKEASHYFKTYNQVFYKYFKIINVYFNTTQL